MTCRKEETCVTAAATAFVTTTTTIDPTTVTAAAAAATSTVSDQFTWTQAKGIIEKFFPREWSTVTESDLTITRIPGGYINRVYLCERTSKSIYEPAKLIIRQSGGGKLIFNEDDETLFKNTFIEELMIFYEASRLSIGPKLYGAYENGRVEEYIASHTLTCNDVDDVNIRREIAHKFASFHSLNVPIRRNKYDDIKRIIFRDMDALTSVQDRIKCIPNHLSDKNINFDIILHYDFLTEYKWLSVVFKSINSRTSLLLSDNNYLNVLVRDRVKRDEEKVVLIDYEAAHYGPRLLDFGGHFVLRTLDWSLPDDKATHCDILEDNDRDHWLSEYRVKLLKLNKFTDLDGDTFDSLSHLREEADLGILMQSLVWSFFLFSRLDTFAVDIGFARATLLLLNLYIRYKPIFLAKYPHWSA